MMSDVGSFSLASGRAAVIGSALLAAFLGIGSASGAPRAGRYYLVGRTRSDLTFIDLKSLQRQGQIASGVMTLVELTSQTQAGVIFDYSQISFSIKCAAAQLKLDQAAFYTLPQALVRRGAITQPWVEVSPNSAGFLMHKIACQRDATQANALAANPSELVQTMRQADRRGRLPTPGGQ